MKYINDKEINDFVTYVNRKMENEKNSEPQNNLQNDNLSKIKQLKELLDIEAITQEEYEQRKRIIRIKLMQMKRQSLYYFNRNCLFTLIKAL